jgi:hypothetical protein
LDALNAIGRAVGGVGGAVEDASWKTGRSGIGSAEIKARVAD